MGVAPAIPIRPHPETPLARRSRRSPLRSRFARRSRGRRSRWLRLRGGRVAGVLACLLLLLALPPVREAVARGVEAVRAAVEASRRAEARRVRIAVYAARYGISAELAEAIYAAAEAERLDPELGFRLVRVESEFNERAVSSAGALGLTQLMPATAADLRPGITREEVFERDTNLRLGFRYLRVLVREYDGDVQEALHAYNRGIGTVMRIRAQGGDPANGYAAKVLGTRGASPVRRGRRGETERPAEPPLHEMAPARLPAGF